ncbi:hypothetical protein [Pseudomonas coronafaciens]|uniref:hypothetical protein n=1 Tax=Pseudomonas coronafaciens TaxID=53409 RepID=UPI000EFF45AA|nr:hypothetical protein [Pseudomonas coronafaciens]
MQAQHITILVGLTVCILLLAVSIKRASEREILQLTTDLRTQTLHDLTPEEAIAERLVSSCNSYWKANHWIWVVELKQVRA